MTHFLIAYMAPLMFCALVVFLLLGFPVAFSLAANGLLFGWIGIELGLLHPALFGALHAGLCSLPKVNDIAVGIALMLFGTGLLGMAGFLRRKIGI